MTTETTVDTGTNELLCVIRDRVAVITLNRPAARNSLSPCSMTAVLATQGSGEPIQLAPISQSENRKR